MNLDITSARRAYDWFHHAFPDFKNNEWCSPDDIMLRNKLERFLIAQGE